MKKFLLLTLAVVVAWTAAMAVPAKPGINTLTLSDGTTIQVKAIGDEWSHSLATADELTIALGDDGFFYYVVSGDMTNVRAHDVANRDAAEISFVNANRYQMTMAALQEAKMQAGSKLRSAHPQAILTKATQVPNNGSPRVPIILVQYTDKSMSNSKANFEAQYNTNAKSVFNYFKDQSNSMYTPQFDIYGIYTLPSTRATYGGNDSSGNDKGVAKMVGDAISKAGNDINWAQYDNNGDGEADVCIVVYAGVGEAQAYGVVPNAVWPCQWSLSSGAYYGDGSGAVTRNGVTIDKFAVFNEVAGSSDSGTTLDGIGTFCHEFSHCLGLPDFYETTYTNGYFGMSYWSLMDTGCYNGGSIDGDTPIGYSAYEKNFMGWLNYIDAVENTFYTLPVFNSKTAENDKAVKITALNSNEYWILENRKKQNWDYYIQDEGILITHFTYVASRWEANTVNNKAVQLATIMPADNSLSTNNLNKDLYGETNHAFGPSTTPAMKANMSASGSLSSSTGGAGTVNKPVTEINLNSDGTASFWYIKGENPAISVNPTSLAFEGYVGETYTKTFTVTGSNLTGNITISKTGSNVFSVSTTSITAANAANGVQVTVTYSPTAAGNATGTLTLSSSGASNVTVSLTGTAQAKTPTLTVNPTSLSFTNCYVGDSYTKTFNVQGVNLTNNVTITRSGSNLYSANVSSITATNAANGVDVTITYAPTAAGSTNATFTIASSGAESKTVTVSGTAQAKVPTLTVDPSSLSLNASTGATVSKTFNVTGKFISNNVTVSLTDANGVFSVSPTTIAANSISETNPVQVTVTFSSPEEGDFSGTITLASTGAESKTIALTASASDGGTASDPYLNIAKYATITDAGATVSGMSTIYKYNEYPSDACAWLTVSNYGARKADANQNWISCEGEDKSSNESWNATDIFLGSSSYFTSTAYYANWNEAYQNFYVTNCSQVKQYSYNIQSSNYSGNVYPLRMEIYECTLNADGTLTEGTTMVDSKQSQQTNATEVVTSDDLDPNKIYKVRIYNDYSRLYEIGFKTPIQGVDTPVASDATSVTDTGFTAHWTACEDAQSYTLRVMPKPEITTELLITEGFSKFTTAGSTDIGSSLNSYMDNAGWTGSTVYTAVGGIRLGSSNAKGTLTSPALDLTNSNGKVSIKFKAKTYTSGYSSDSNCGLTVSCGNSSESVTIPNTTEAEYTQVLDCNAAAGQNVSFATTTGRKRVIITNIEIYSGDITAGEAKAEGEMLFSGITATEYTVTGLLPLTTYIYDVKAVYPTVESSWSNLIEVTTLEPSSAVPGDVNGDGEVTSADVTALYSYLLSGDDSDITNGDQDGDGDITTHDVTVVYEILLGTKLLN